jgi:hypothetical protein
MTTLLEAANAIQQFEHGSLTKRISAIETILQGSDKQACETIFPSLAVKPTLLTQALILKQTAGQINVLIHAVGILLSLPHILQDNEGPYHWAQAIRADLLIWKPTTALQSSSSYKISKRRTVT